MELDPKTISRALAGDRSAFQELVEQTWSMVFLFIHQRVSDRERARDLVQDTYLQAFDKRDSLRSGGSFLSWLLTIASRKVIDSYRRRGAKPEVRLPEADVHPVVDSGSSPAAAAERSEDSQILHHALGQLDDLYRTVLILRYWSGLAPGQIARLLEEPEGTIRNRIFRAHLRLRELLESPNFKEDWQSQHGTDPRPARNEGGPGRRRADTERGKRTRR